MILETMFSGFLSWVGSILYIRGLIRGTINDGIYEL